MQDRVVDGLLIRHSLPVLGPTFDHLWPVEKEARPFSELLREIEEADRRQDRDQSAPRAGCR